MQPSKRYLKLEDGTVWVHPGAAADLQNRLRYNPLDGLTREDVLVIASALSDYHELATRPEFRGTPAMIRCAMGRIL